MRIRTKQPAVLLAAICVAAAVLFSTASVLAADVFTQSLITVGQGFVVLDADLGVVSFSVENTATDAQQAYADNAQTSQRIAQALQAADLPGLEITVRQPNLWPKTGLLSKEVTYTASSGLDVKVGDVNLIGQVAAIGLQNGASAILGVRFDSSALETAKQQALERAVQDAIAKGQVMSAASGLRLIMVRELRDTNDIQVINPSALQGSTAGEQSSLPALAGPISRGQVIVTATITMVFDVALDKSKDVLSQQ